MRKFMRGLYLWVIYICALPLSVLTVLGMFGYLMYKAIRKHYDISECIDYFKAFCIGAKEGHEMNWYWVKTGETISDKLLRESLES